MKTRIILALLGLSIATLIGCSAVTQNPQVIITKVDPVNITSDSAQIAITFKNINKVDAILTTHRYTFRGIAGASKSPVYSHSLYLPGSDESTTLAVDVAGVTMMRTNLGSPLTLWIQFWGTDAYGYNKTFATDSVAINCN
jgi:hypothetical protein